MRLRVWAATLGSRWNVLTVETFAAMSQEQPAAAGANGQMEA